MQPLALVAPLPALHAPTAPLLTSAPSPPAASKPHVSIAVVAACSILPGGGHFYLGLHSRGALYLGGFFVSFLMGLPLLVWIGSMVDACVLAWKRNQNVQQFDH